MGVGRFFNKIKHGGASFFHKLDNGASNFFMKTVPDIAHKAGEGLTVAGDAVNTGLRKVGNTLEKNSALLGSIGAGLSMAIGQPELAVGFESAGLAGQQAGQSIKQARGRVNNVVGNTNQRLQMGVGTIQNKASDARDALTNRINSFDNRLAMAQNAVRTFNTGQVNTIQPN